MIEKETDAQSAVQSECKSAEPQKSAACEKKQRPVRRVGTLTMGIALIITGLLIVCCLVFPNLDLRFFFKLCPLLLVILGIEVLVGSLHNEKLKYDFLSMIVCFFVICGSFSASLIPLYIQYYGPDRSATEFRLSAQLDDLCVSVLGDDERVAACSNSVYIQPVHFDRKIELHELKGVGYVSITIELTGPYESKEAFAADAADLLAKLRATDLNFSSVDFFWRGGDSGSMDLILDGSFAMNRSISALTEMVQDNAE